eukprot:GABW01001986.1.p1 GENE.GABW01001986.1~~GABW01001986.1.p1  ORF type:complete len:84 (-),score=30.38 GABW01001986.1:3-254(-)
MIADTAISQLKRVVRGHYSSPSLHGALLAGEILTSPDLMEQWKKDCVLMSSRIKEMRQALVDALKEVGSERDWSHVTKQKHST